MISSDATHSAVAEDEMAVTIYTPDSALGSPKEMLRGMLKDLRKSRYLAWRLAVRDIRAQYRQAFLGIAWAFIMPLANTVTWIFLSSTGIVKVADTSVPYPVFVFTGTMLWAIFIDALNAPLSQTNGAKAMLAKLNFPREALLVAGIYKTMFNAGIKILLLLCALPLLGVSWSWTLLLFPLGLLSLVLVGTAIGLVFTPVGMLYTDIGRGIGLIFQFVMYVTPVVFPVPQSGWASVLIMINPITPVIQTCRDWLTGSSPEFFVYFLAVNVLALGLLVVVWAMYRLAMPILIERMSS